jgi:hypothetical protein
MAASSRRSEAGVAPLRGLEEQAPYAEAQEPGAAKVLKVFESRSPCKVPGETVLLFAQVSEELALRAQEAFEQLARKSAEELDKEFLCDIS